MKTQIVVNNNRRNNQYQSNSLDSFAEIEKRTDKQGSVSALAYDDGHSYGTHITVRLKLPNHRRRRNGSAPTTAILSLTSKGTNERN